MPLLAATIFLSAFLLFLVQPLIGKYILPWFGGSPAVWTTCMLLFQTLLLLGYVYAHVLTKLRSRTQAIVHAVVLIGSVAMLPIVPDPGWKPAPGDEPVGRILLLLLASVGLQFTALAATGPLLQSWIARHTPSRSPYWLYALSNAGSLIALLSFPFVLEPMVDRLTLSRWWSIGFVIFATLCAACAVLQIRIPRDPVPRGRSAASDEAASAIPLTRAVDRVLWIMLPACGSILLLAVTNQLCQDVAVIPFLWVLPLSLYLVTFILSFHGERMYRRPFFIAALALAMTLTAVMIRWNPAIYIQVAGYSMVLFAGCMVCHGELYRLRPPAARLTEYYMLMSLGGALGGVFVAIVAPLIFTRYLELPIGLVATATLMLTATFRDGRSRLAGGRPRWIWLALVFAFLIPSELLRSMASRPMGNAIVSTRNFYGLLAVYEHQDGKLRELRHGRINHGVQFIDQDRSTWPTSYYSHDSGVGLAMLHLEPGRPRRIGIVGLGAGTLAAYGKSGDTFRFYEINPEVQRLARSEFTFLSQSPESIEIVPGDARLSMERESDQTYDILVLDAFSSDAIPVHLLTAEAFDIYRRHVDLERGVIAAHISNHHLDLKPVLRAAARHLGVHAAVLRNDADEAKAINSSTWVLLTRNRAFLDSEAIRLATLPPDSEREILWTDDFSNLLGILK
jgi:hypothetical protein